MEYKNRLLNIDQDRTPAGMGAESMYFPAGVPSEDNDEMEYSHQNESPEESPHRTIGASQIMSQQRHESHNLSKTQGRPPISANMAHTTMMNESISAGRRQPETSKIFQATSLSRTNNKTRTDFERDPETTVFGDGFQKKVTATSQPRSKIHSDVSRTMIKTNAAPLSMTMGATQMQPIQQQQYLPMMIEEEPESEFIRIGDIVCIEFIEQVFDSLKEYAKIDGGKDNMRFAKILEKPDFEYKGILFSDGIVNKEISLTTEASLKDQSGGSHISPNKAIFKIEVVQDYKFSQQFSELTAEMESAEVEELENPDEEEEKRVIYEDIKKKFKREQRANRDEQEYNKGRKVLFGMQVLFRHMASGLYLTLDTKKLSTEYGWYELHLAPCTTYSKFQLMPAFIKTKGLNSGIKYDDSFIVQNSNDVSEYYLH